ncbi:fluoroacetyl-CoA thioesterase [Methylobacterium sp. PvP062]|uniref:Thioesterase superfamily protein n=2 Tax=Methylobacterium radiotolerans TaxID=31998 RepID=B1M8N7_METRJ|nr:MULTISPECIES: thioesterase family protein [Methylobacterium]MCX7333655.1 thioesterase family protein [Hyphomicrobiales bacterium]ACB27862.1 thioesterase superfamily protein [Methylobacterium radiotolerans JCM 2831]KIU28955.1 thioesterase [Methylobacterium radiotolerans]KTS06736.1 thioesterase [Methylobacterium radiotolerans]KTS48620.1 thioesterase [Methylobacterium radiotolerans]
MQDIPLGAKGSFAMLVGPSHLASQFKDNILPPVFATPMMVLIMENAALNAVRQYLDPGESAVGTKVDVTHMAATPVGHRVRAEAEVVGVAGRQIQFRVAAWDETEQIGAGTHERMIVDIERLGKRLAGKQAAPSRRV